MKRSSADAAVILEISNKRYINSRTFNGYLTWNEIYDLTIKFYDSRTQKLAFSASTTKMLIDTVQNLANSFNKDVVTQLAREKLI